MVYDSCQIPVNTFNVFDASVNKEEIDHSTKKFLVRKTMK